MIFVLLILLLLSLASSPGKYKSPCMPQADAINTNSISNIFIINY